MQKRAQSSELDKSLFHSIEMAIAVAGAIQTELQSNSYSSEKSRRNRECKLNNMYTVLFTDKDMSIFTYSQIDAMLQSGTEKDMIRIFNVVCYLLKKGVINDNKLKRLLSFQHRFSTPGVKYSDFEYLMHSEIYEIFVSESVVMESNYSEKLFFLTCNGLNLYDEEILNITNEWCEKVKSDSGFTPSTRCVRLPMMHNLAQKLFSSKSIDEIKRADMANIEEVYLLLEYLEFIDQKHKLPEDICYLFSFKKLMVGKGRIKFKELCQVDDIFNYVITKDKRKGNRICKLDIPTNTPLFDDMAEYISTLSYNVEAFTRFIENFYLSMGNSAVTEATKLSMNTLKESVQFFRDSKNDKLYQSYLYSFYNYCYIKYQINFF